MAWRIFCVRGLGRMATSAGLGTRQKRSALFQHWLLLRVAGMLAVCSIKEGSAALHTV